MKHKPYGVYERFFKRPLDILCAALALIVFCWLYAIVAILVRIKLGSPVLYKEDRIGKNEKTFTLYKFRSMNQKTDAEGNLLPDDERLTRFGKVLRATSLDELPEAINILKGDMSVVGPRPMPVIYRGYFTEEEQRRHDVRPGLSGWAQVNGRNSISWDEKFALDCEYVDRITFAFDVKIIGMTVAKALKREDIGQGQQRPVSLHIERADRSAQENGG